MDPTLAPSWFNSDALSYPTSQPYQQDPWAGAYGSAQQQPQQQDPWSYYFGAPAAPQQQQHRGQRQSQMQKFGQAGLNMLKPQNQMPYGMTPTPYSPQQGMPMHSPIPLPYQVDPFRRAQQMTLLNY